MLFDILFNFLFIRSLWYAPPPPKSAPGSQLLAMRPCNQAKLLPQTHPRNRPWLLATVYVPPATAPPPRSAPTPARRILK